ncbi:MAG TPA: hypothetical protein VGT61_08725 [Thermomicrobiales bacterium]|jgi:hypothetical protein|nr:hypothetical protein [Thermomicrobiales bacterium]
MGARQRSWHPTGRIAAALRATCLILLGLGIGIGLQQAWPHLFSARPGEEPGLTTSDGTGGDGDYAALPASGTGAVIDSTAGDNAYVPAPGNNPPLAVPGNGTANRISAIQNRDTWQAVREQAGELAPLLYPPIPPGAFESVAVGRVGPAEVLVRYNGSGMRLMVGAGTAVLDVAAVMTIPSAQQFQATVRGRPATVSMAQSSTADADPNALAPGMVLSVTWTEPGATLDAAGNVQATSVPYAVAATGVPVDVVMAFAGSLVPIETGWDTLLDGLPNGEAPPVPATMPAGFGPATLLAPPVGAGTAVTDVAPGWTIASSRAGTGATSDLIVFTAAAAPAADPATGPTTAIRVAGQDGTLSTSGTLGTASARWEIRWQADSTEYGITLTGPGITASEVDSLIDGMTTRLERLPVADRAA